MNCRFFRMSREVSIERSTAIQQGSSAVSPRITGFLLYVSDIGDDLENPCFFFVYDINLSGPESPGAIQKDLNKVYQ